MIYYHPLKLTKEEKERLAEWKKREGWKPQKTIKRMFNYSSVLGDGDSMPRNLVVSGVDPRHWSGKGKMVCVMCGYTSTVTNIHRECPKLPADEELNMEMLPWGRICYDHDEAHFIMKGRKGGRKVFTTHRSINMVCVS